MRSRAFSLVTSLALIFRLASSIKRERRLTSGRLTLNSAAVVVPHPDRANRRYELPPNCGGEDAYFIEDAAGAVGIADGVSAWGLQGIDSGIWSRQLMNFAAQEARAGTQHPKSILKQSHARTTAKGSSTALILTLASQPATHEETELLKGKATIAHLGDSGFLHMRNGKVLFQSKPQLHSFDLPFQLSRPGDEEFGDPPSDAQIIELQSIAPGDMFVLGTDGLYDNMFVEDIVGMLSHIQTKQQKSLAELVAKTIAARAAECSRDESRHSPFSVAASLAGLNSTGGKLDDITVLVSIVGEAQLPSLRGKRQ